jgi:hypothetical protein
MNEETRSNSTEFAEQIHDTGSDKTAERLSSKRLFRLAAELQDLVTTRRARNRRIPTPANLTHYVE